MSVKQNGPAIKAIREAKGIGVRVLARSIGRNHGFLSHVEAERCYASTVTIALIAAELDVPVAAITRVAP